MKIFRKHSKTPAAVDFKQGLSCWAIFLIVGLPILLVFTALLVFKHFIMP